MIHSPIEKIPYELTTLPSGLRVLTVPMKSFQSIGVAIWVGTGSRYESERLSGISHFLEHMVFKGTEKRTSRQIRLEIEGVGGIVNAFTGEESTCFFTKMLKGHLKTGLEVLSDMVLNATLHSEDLEKEKAVILEEIKMYQDIPSHCVHEEISQMLWPNHPLGRSISGTYESVSKIKRNDLINFKNDFYGDRNILISVSGAVEHKVVVEMVKSLFKKPRPSRKKAFLPATFHQKKPAVAFLEKKTEQTHFVIAMHTFSRFHPDKYKLALLNVILGANMSSRLFEVVREKRGLAYEIRSSLGFYHDAGYLTISAGVETSKASKAIEVILEELKKICSVGVHASELRRAKDYFQSQLRMALEDTLDHLLWVGERIIDGNKIPDLNKIHDRIERVHERDIRAVAKRIFTNNNLNLALIGPLSFSDQNTIKKQFEF